MRRDVWLGWVEIGTATLCLAIGIVLANEHLVQGIAVLGLGVAFGSVCLAMRGEMLFGVPGLRGVEGLLTGAPVGLICGATFLFGLFFFAFPGGIAPIHAVSTPHTPAAGAAARPPARAAAHREG